MRIFDMNGTELSSVDMEKGCLLPAQLLVKHHEAVAPVKEVGHYEVTREYPNGGKDLHWVVDIPAVEGQEAWDEYEDILRYLPFTREQLGINRMRELKQLLRDTDYRILKVVEGVQTLAEIAETLRQRAQWRKEYNELEKEYGDVSE